MSLPGLPSVTVVLIDALLTAAIGLGAFMYGRQVGEDRVVAQQAREDRIAQVAYEASQKAAVDAVSKIEVKHVTVQGKVQEIVRENTVFRDCKSGPDLVRDFNSTIPGWRPDAAPRGQLPAASAPH